GGTCLADDVSPGEVPQVRVTDGGELLRAAPAGARPARPQPAGGGLRAGEAGVGAGAGRPAGKRLFTVAEIESYRNRSPKRPLRPEDVAPQFDVEDGSDRREWEAAGAAPAQDDRLKAELGQARACLRDVEYVLDVPTADGLFGGE